MKRRRRRRIDPLLLFTLMAGVLATALTSFFTWRWEWKPLPAYLAGINASTFGFYAYDKLAARWKRLRVPEKVLHALALVGGTPAAILGQWGLRHKTLKGSFRLVFWCIVVVQAAVVVWLVERE
jgi:uncharacterized membrane protein YsdA (DUF1294 family)